MARIISTIHDLAPGASIPGSSPIVGESSYRSRFTYLDARDYGLVFDGLTGGGGTDNTAALQAMIDDSDQGQPCIIGYEPSATGGGHRIKITDTLIMKSGLIFHSLAPGGSGAVVAIDFWGGDADDAIATPPASGYSEISLQGFKLRDRRTNPARTGRGIVIDNVFNGVTLKYLHVMGFSTNIFVGGVGPGNDSDCVHIEDVFTTEPLLYGIHLQRVSNYAVLQAIGGDTPDTIPTALALIHIEDTGPGGGTFLVQGIKHECANPTTDTLSIGNDSTGVASAIAMRGAVSGGGNAVVHFAGHGAGWVCQGITTSNTAFGDAATVAQHLLLADVSGVDLVPSSTIRQIAHWTGGVVNASHQTGSWVNQTFHGAGTGSPEGVITAPPGSTWHRQDGGDGQSHYAKNSGTGNTGWLPLGGYLAGSASWDPASLTSGTQTSTTVTVTGAVLGDFAEASFALDLQGCRLSAYVSAADTATVVLRNDTGGTINLGSSGLRVRVFPR